MSEWIKAVIFDLDGVITDTAEYHFRGWKCLADEEGIVFTREDNERLRGVSRRESLLRLLKDRQVPEEEMQEMMARKNAYYQELLTRVTADDLLPGVAELLDQLDADTIPYAVASASRNARTVVDSLDILGRLSALADGNSVKRQKPFPDLFRRAAALLNRQPHECLVIEDAEAGVEAALVAGMPCLALGPEQRFMDIQRRFGPIARRDDLQNVQLDELHAIVHLDENWTIVQNNFEPNRQHYMETVFTIGNGYFCSRGNFEEGYPDEHALTLAHGIFDDMPIVFTELVNLPNWLDLSLTVDSELFRLDQGRLIHFRRCLDLRQGILRRDVRWQSPRGTIVDLTFERFASYTQKHIGALRVLITAVNQPCRIEVKAGINGHVSNDDLLHWRHIAQGETADGVIWLHSRTRHGDIQLGTTAAVIATEGTALECQQCPSQPRVFVRTDLEVTQTLQVDKLVSYTASRDQVECPSDVVKHASVSLEGHTYDNLRAAQVSAWDALWDDCDIIIEGDAEAQLAVRLHLFQLLITTAQHNERVRNQWR